MGIRRNILANATDQANFIEGCRRLKRTDAGLSTSDLGIDGGPRASSRPLSVWDLFVIWHVWAMQEMAPDRRRNAAHMGPVFLPWHRWYLLLLEFQIQNALEVSQDEFGLPYWDWAVDGGDLTLPQQRSTAAIWDVIGGDGDPSGGEIQDGPFTATDFVVNIEQGPGQRLRCLLYTSPSPRDLSTSRMPSSA